MRERQDFRRPQLNTWDSNVPASNESAFIESARSGTSSIGSGDRG